MRVLLLGGSGFVGRHLAEALRARGDEVIVASLREPHLAAATAADCDAIVNLSGKPLGQRWNAAVKRRIESSRVELPRRFLEALAQVNRRATVYVTASGVGYYGTSDTETFTEESPPGADFLARVCIGWEREAVRAEGLGMRVACIRTGVALGTDGGALAKLLPPFRAGIGGRVGTGSQWISWIHIADLAQIYVMALDGANGAINACAPNAVTNETLTRELGEALHRPTRFAVPALALKAALGEGAQLLLTGQRVVPRRLRDMGYRFVFSDLKAALANLL
ncbi:MAG: TIGR01777 family oxidoreductase [Candidatus Eremiobacteraeota bacterium]|nr:TIGR01777 family oxidoreductase [Candidatus Eremiobacteraeota bacterium]